MGVALVPEFNAGRRDLDYVPQRSADVQQMSSEFIIQLMLSLAIYLKQDILGFVNTRR